MYTADRSLDEALTPMDGDVVLVPEGYHPVGVPAGYDCYYLNVMAGPNRAWYFTLDPDHAWLMNWSPCRAQGRGRGPSGDATDRTLPGLGLGPCIAAIDDRLSCATRPLGRRCRIAHPDGGSMTAIATVDSPLLRMVESTPTDFWNDSCAVAELGVRRRARRHRRHLEPGDRASR